MTEVRCITTFFFVVMVIYFREAAIGQQLLFVRRGDDAALHCADVTDNPSKCHWAFSNSSKSKSVPLFGKWKLKKAAKPKSDRLSVTENCTLLLKRVTEEDVGRYTCGQVDRGREHGGDAQVHLFVFTTTTTAMETETATATFVAPTKVATDNDSKLKALAWFFFLIVFLSALVLPAVAFRRYKKRKGNKTKMNENLALGLNPAEPRSGPGTRQDTTDPEDEVSYASVSFTKTNRKVQLQNNDDEGETVTYSSVKVSSASARASTDPRRLYAAVNKRQK